MELVRFPDLTAVTNVRSPSKLFVIYSGTSAILGRYLRSLRTYCVSGHFLTRSSSASVIVLSTFRRLVVDFGPPAAAACVLVACPDRTGCPG